MTEIENQTHKILRFMEAGNVITQRIASAEFECDRLGARIWDLRHDGVPVLDAWDYKLDEKGRVVKKWKKYFLAAQYRGAVNRRSKLYKNELGLYDLNIKDERGEIIVDVKNVTFLRAVSIIEEYMYIGNGQKEGDRK